MLLPGPDLTAEGQVRASLARIAERDRDVRAWTHLDAHGALAAARALDREAAPRGPLHGLTLAVKDVIDVGGMPTRHNSPLAHGRAALADAPCVAVLREAGAVILGKTDTTEFAAAGRDAASANPRAFDRTPGGSSAGSAAAVADGHVALALATQTGGSTIRPASFCGVHALKPSWGLVSREGAKLYAASLDTIGFYAQGFAELDAVCSAFDFAEPGAVSDRPRIAICRPPGWDKAEAPTRAAMDAAYTALVAAGCEVETIDLPALFDTLWDAFRTILFREGAAAFLDIVRCAPDLAHADFHERVASTGTISDAQWAEAEHKSAEARAAIALLIAPYDAILAPSAPGVAPPGRWPGDPVFNAMWTLLHLPVANVPFFEADGLPVGLSLIGPRFGDRRLLATATQVERLLIDHANREIAP